MKVLSTLYRFGSLAALALIFTVGSRTLPAQSPDSEAVSKLLVQAKSEAALMEYDAALLDSFTRSKVSWESHAGKLNEIAEHINALGKLTRISPSNVHLVLHGNRRQLIKSTLCSGEWLSISQPPSST